MISLPQCQLESSSLIARGNCTVSLTLKGAVAEADIQLNESLLLKLRDAGVLVHARGFRLSAAGVVNMFPHTAHVESIAVFERVEYSEYCG